MGGHAAWRKRLANGELAKGSGGAMLRHRPRWGRRGKDLILNRKGHIAGGNPKKKKIKKGTTTVQQQEYDEAFNRSSVEELMEKAEIWKLLLLTLVGVVAYGLSFLEIFRSSRGYSRKMT